jgi:Zn-dependent protease
MDFLTNPIITMLVSLIVLIYSAILHEIAHGLVADRLGDPTARLLGRLTLNPKPHIDPILTIALPLILVLSGSPIIFGGAKPVPIDPFNLKEGRKDVALVSLAGPLTNIIVAIIAAIGIHGINFFLGLNSLEIPAWITVVRELLLIIVRFNVLLAIFNLLPLPPLDGSKVFSLLLPEKTANAFLSIGNMGVGLILLFLLLPTGMRTIISTLYYFFISLLGF